MNVIFRVDASRFMGIGHLMRCLSLADTFRTINADCLFISRDFEETQTKRITKSGHKLAVLPCSKEQEGLTNETPYKQWLGVPWQQDAEESASHIPEIADFLIVDHYGIDASWHKTMNQFSENMIVIDDLANREYFCDFLVDQTWGRKEEEYKDKVPVSCKLLLGSDYSLLRKEFSEFRDFTLKNRKAYKGIQNILVSMGGMDQKNMSIEILDTLNQINWVYEPVINVVIPGSSKYTEKIYHYAEHSQLAINILTDAMNMHELMSDADLAIGTAGTTSWERCSLGLPALVFIDADNQKTIGKRLETAGAIKLWNSREELKIQISEILGNQELWFSMMRSAAQICDGTGCSRLIRRLTANDKN
jgi:UDP-2,4-diacetamido-2,4,6-trideoxy-beta-L-altropyranose hydrolase